MTQGGNGILYVNVSVAGGTATPVIVDTGSDGLLISGAHVNMAQLGMEIGAPVIKHYGTANNMENDLVEQYYGTGAFRRTTLHQARNHRRGHQSIADRTNAAGMTTTTTMPPAN